MTTRPALPDPQPHQLAQPPATDALKPVLPRPHTTLELASFIANLAEGKKSDNTAILDVEHISGFADFFVIATGHSSTQIKAISRHIIKGLRQIEWPILGYEDDAAGQWHLIDTGEVVVHIMREDVRQHYDLESFWSHSTPVPPETWQESA